MNVMKPLATCSLAALMMTAALAGSPAFGQSKVGTTAAQFLGISVGPRAIAMGSAYAASNEDVTSLYWNPGAIAQASKSQFVFANTEWLVGTKFRWFGLMLSLDDENAVGLSVTQLDYGEDEVTTVANPDGTGQYWSAKDLAVAVSYSRRLTDRFSIGGSAKYVNQTIYHETASNVTFDVGLLYATGFSGLRIGMSLSNFGGDLTLSGQDLINKVNIDPAVTGGNKNLVGYLKTDPWPMPLFFRVGVSLEAVKSEQFVLTLAGDALRPNDNDMSGNFGAELGFEDTFFLRGGYKSLFAHEPALDKTDQQEGLALGAGLRYNVEGVASVEVNYAWSKFGVFGNLNTIGVAIGF
jgi:opacity protein-like surface antigen